MTQHQQARENWADLGHRISRAQGHLAGILAAAYMPQEQARLTGKISEFANARQAWLDVEDGSFSALAEKIDAMRTSCSYGGYDVVLDYIRSYRPVETCSSEHADGASEDRLPAIPDTHS